MEPHKGTEHSGSISIPEISNMSNFSQNTLARVRKNPNFSLKCSYQVEKNIIKKYYITAL
jgi:hypothetical protein